MFFLIHGNDETRRSTRSPFATPTSFYKKSKRSIGIHYIHNVGSKGRKVWAGLRGFSAPCFGLGPTIDIHILSRKGRYLESRPFRGKSRDNSKIPKGDVIPQNCTNVLQAECTF